MELINCINIELITVVEKIHSIECSHAYIKKYVDLKLYKLSIIKSEKGKTVEFMDEYENIREFLLYMISKSKDKETLNMWWNKKEQLNMV